jgi:hypothetical protein
MSTPSRRYKYPLEPMRKKREWERDGLGHELSRVEATAAKQRKRLSETEESFARARKAWQEQVESNRALDLGLQRVLSAYFAQTGLAMESRKKELDATLESRAALAERLTKAQRVLDGIERHKTRLAKEHRRDELSREYRDIDSDWVQRTAHTERKR